MTINPETAGIEVSIEATADGKAVLEDALALLNNANDSENRLIVVLDEFEEIAHLEPGTDELLCGVNHTARKFVGLMYIDRTLDETTILHFRHFLEKHDFGGKIFELINERFNEAGPTLWGVSRILCPGSFSKGWVCLEFCVREVFQGQPS